MPTVAKRYGVNLSRRQRETIAARIYRRQGEFAKQIGVNNVWLGRVLGGQLRPSRESLEKICDALDLEVSVVQVIEIKPKGAPRGWGREGTKTVRRGMEVGGKEEGAEAAPDWCI